ncbi:MAG TPA: DUF222 domain-containing protein, partial [Acidimicrobiales bacterium]|nr:DUF222 domain-containing protein [Acidimicrobiales bacterium]
MLNATVAKFLDAVAGLDVAVDGEEIAAIRGACEIAVAKTMEPLRAFDELLLYQLTKASSSAQFLERCAGLAPAEARGSVILARKLKAMPLTEAAWIEGALTSGQVRAIAGNVTKRLAERYRADEAAVLAIIGPLDAKETDTAMQRWVAYTQASLADDPDTAPRDDEFFHSEVTGGRYFSKGSFGEVTGAVIDKAIELAETDNPRDNDTRSPAQRRGEALADVCGFYVDYQNRLAADPDADAANVPKKRNLPQLIAVSSTGDIANRAGAQLLNGPHIDHHAFEALSCTAQLLRLVLDEDGAIRSYQMLPATVTDALFGAIAARDQHCRWPGCHKKPIHCDLHHLHHRENGGLNTPCNCCLLCKYHHHRAAHDPKIRLVMEPDGTLHITYPDGTTETTKPPIRQP